MFKNLPCCNCILRRYKFDISLTQLGHFANLTSLIRATTNSYPSFSTSSITRSEMFMPQTEIIFVRQSCFRIDGQLPD
jgi:hypothetical protein